MSVVNRRNCLIMLAGGTWSSRAQQTPNPPQEDLPTIKIDVDLVNVTFSVRNKKGALVPTLTKDDFTVSEDGKQQTVQTFARETDLPLTIGMLIDVSRSQEYLIPQEKQAGAMFFEKVLRQKDMAFLISFGADAELLQDSTNSNKLLRAGLERLRLSGGASGIHPGPVPTASNPKGTILYDAVYLAAAEKLRTEVGRKAIVLITDGMDFGSSYTRQQAIEASHRADTMIYSIYYVDERQYSMSGFGASDGDLKRMSEETGGRLFRVSRSEPLNVIFDQIQEEMRSQYTLSYRSTNESRDSAFRKLEIKAADKNLKVQARKGYYAGGRA